MTKTKPTNAKKPQSERFKQAAQKLIDDGELNPIEADHALEALVSKGLKHHPVER